MRHPRQTPWTPSIPTFARAYAEEIVVGVDRQVGQSWTFGVHGIYRSLRRVIEDTCVPSDTCENYAFFNPGSSTEVCLAGVCQPLFPSIRPARRYFRGIEVTAQKRLSDHWMLYASYLYSARLKGNYDGAFRAIGGFFAKDPNITDDFDYPEFRSTPTGNLTLDRMHQAKLQAAYVFPFGLTLSASGYYQTGTPLSKIGWWDGYGAARRSSSTPRGTEGRSPDTLRDRRAPRLRRSRSGRSTFTFSRTSSTSSNRQQTTDDRPGLGVPPGGQRLADADQLCTTASPTPGSSRGRCGSGCASSF